MDRKIDVTYCILHYQNAEITLKCVDSILESNDNLSFHVVVVDNGSPNKSGEELKETYKGNDKITVILSDNNLGFAKGNNIAYSFAKNDLKSEIIVVMNSDTLIDERFSARSIYAECSNLEYEIVAPDIVNSVGYHQNPFLCEQLSSKIYLMALIKNFLWFLGVNLPVFGSKIYRVYARRTERKNRCKENVECFDEDTFVPHGSCLIFTEKWIKKEEFVFVPITFLYCEEDILCTYARKKGYKIAYRPNLRLRHLEDGSLNYEYTVGKKRLSFLCVQQNKSIMKLLKMRFKSKIGNY